MNNRNISKTVGILILTGYLMLGAEATDNKSLVLLLDILSGLSVIGASLLMFLLLRKYGKLPSIGYIAFKIIEGLLMFAAGSFFLFDSTQHLRPQIYGGIHTWVFMVGAFLFYYLLYVSKLVPRFISVWGAIAVSCLLLITVLKLLNIETAPLQFLLILIITNEFFLSAWLLTKGFSKT